MWNAALHSLALRRLLDLVKEVLLYFCRSFYEKKRAKNKQTKKATQQEKPEQDRACDGVLEKETDTVNYITRGSTHIIFTTKCACVLNNMNMCAPAPLFPPPSPKSISSLTKLSPRASVRCCLLPLCPSIWMVELLIWIYTNRLKNKTSCACLLPYIPRLCKNSWNSFLPCEWFQEMTFPKPLRSISNTKGDNSPRGRDYSRRETTRESRVLTHWIPGDEVRILSVNWSYCYRFEVSGSKYLEIYYSLQLLFFFF